MEFKFKNMGERIYLSAFILYLAYAFSLTTMVSLLPIIQTVTLQIALTLVVLKIVLFDHFSREQLLGYGIIFALAFLVAFYMQDFNVVMLFIFALGARNIDYQRIVKLYFWEATILLVLTIILTLHGDVVNLTYLRDGHIRNALGIVYPTNFAAHIFYLMLCYIYIRRNQLHWFEYVGGLGLTLLTYRVTWARLDFYLMLAMLLFFCLLRYGFKNHPVKWVSRLAIWSTIIGALLIYGLTYSYQTNHYWLVKLDQLLSGRLRLGRQAFSQYPLSNFGRLITENGFGGLAGKVLSEQHHTTYFYIDSSFIRLLLMQGTWYTLIMIGGFTTAVRRFFKQGDWLLPLMTIFIAISSMIDEHFNVVAYNPFILIMFACFDDWFNWIQGRLLSLWHSVETKIIKH